MPAQRQVVTLGGAQGGAPGHRFGQRFRIEALIGRGGMSQVFRALDEQTGEAVALKLLLDGGPQHAARLAREAELLAELRHPAIVRHVAHGQAPDGAQFLAMEWLEGQDLAARLAGGRLAVDDALRLVRRVADALAAAHGRGVIHRDLKPSNVFLVGGEVDRVKVLDFGVARRLAGRDTLTRTGALVGTPAYMSPEQVRDERPLTPACDVFALGCILYECLCGRPPFVAESLASLFVQILLDEPTPAAALRPDVPPALARLLARMLAKEPGARPADAAALLVELDRLPRDEVSADGPTMVVETGPRGQAEMQLCSVVYAVPAAAADEAPRAAIGEALAGLGALVEWLVDGSLVSVIASAASAIDQALLAAHAALVVRGLWPEARIALSTGKTEVGGRRPVGEAAERSARLLLEATSPGIWLDPLSARLLERRFILQPSGAAYVLAGEHVTEDAARPLMRRATPCVGRESELGLLDLVVHGCAQEAEARAVLVVGAPGSGKSRLRQEFLRRLGPDRGGFLVLEGAAEWMRAGAAYGLLVRCLRRLCGLVGELAADEARRRFAARIGVHVPAADAARVVEFLAEMCGLAGPDGGSPALRAARQDPSLMHEQIRRAFVDWLRGECRAAPVVLLLDDLQWGDRLTVALIEQALRALADAPLMVLAFARPDLAEAFPRLWAEHHPQEIALRPLGRRACERLIHHMLGHEVAPEVVARLIERSAGHPLFLEEMIRAVAESREDDAPPDTVLAMLQARLGRLPADQRRLLRAASVFGETFDGAGLRALLGPEVGAAAVDVGLAQLVEAEILERAPSGGYVFRHDLVRHAAYALISAGELGELHRAAGLHLERASEPEPRVVAEHLARGGEPRRAGRWLLLAARQAFDRGDADGARQLAARALAGDCDDEVRGGVDALLARLAYWQNDYVECARRSESALARMQRGGGTWFRVLGDAVVASARLGRFDEVARLLAATDTPHVDEPARLERIVCLARAALQALVGASVANADELLARLSRLVGGARLEEPYARAQVDHAFGLRAALRGDLAAYVRRLESVTAAFEEAGDLRNLAVERTTLAGCYFQLGLTERAERLGRENLGLCESLRAPQAIGFAKMTLGLILLHRPEAREEARRLLAEAAAEYGEHAHPRRLGILRIYRALLAHEDGDDGAAVAEAERACRLLAGASPSFHTWALAALARSQLRLGRVADARSSARAAVALYEQLGALPASELMPLCVLSEVERAAGAHADARAHAAAACARLDARAGQIDDPSWRAAYLAIPIHVRLRELAARAAEEPAP